jgi:hypothetical protein
MRGFLSDKDAREAKLFDVAAKVVRETDKAWLIDHGGGEAWVPKSQVEKNPDGTFTMPEWMAVEKGIA